MPGEFPPFLNDVRLDADRDRVVDYDGYRSRVARVGPWNFTVTFDVTIDEKTYQDLAEQFAKNGWRGPNTAAVLGALVMNLQNGKR